ncbi:hypothetical protein TNCV_1435601 [Trichonephila clavipes]|nr:hypothetical protein TNCV_1435601 [Trichonephila clavipes]
MIISARRLLLAYTDPSPTACGYLIIRYSHGREIRSPRCRVTDLCPDTTDNPSCRMGALLHVKSQSPHIGLVWKLDESSASSGVVYAIRPLFRKSNNVCPLSAVVTQHALKSVDMFPSTTTSPDLSPIEHEWNINGRQFQHHPPLAFSVSVLID